MPAAVQFYHLLTTPLERALPKLVEKACGQGMRVLIHGTSEQCEALDRALWVNDPDSFIPHGSDNSPNPERQPVYLTRSMDNANKAQILMIADGATCEEQETYERICDIFDGGDEQAVAAARERWKAYADQGLPLTYIRQKEGGGWEKIREDNQ